MMLTSSFLTIILIVSAYGIGSIPFGLIFTKLDGRGDIRTIGSGNIGATNVLRTGSRKLAVLTLIFDAGKGAVAVVTATYFADAHSAAFPGLSASASDHQQAQSCHQARLPFSMSQRGETPSGA